MADDDADDELDESDDEDGLGNGVIEGDWFIDKNDLSYEDNDSDEDFIL